MKAYIKKEKWEEFKYDYLKYGFTQAINPKAGYVKVIDKEYPMFVAVIRKTRELKLIVGNGESPFMEVQQQYYQELYDNNFVEFKKGKFD